MSGDSLVCSEVKRLAGRCVVERRVYSISGKSAAHFVQILGETGVQNGLGEHPIFVPCRVGQ